MTGEAVKPENGKQKKKEHGAGVTIKE